MARKAVKKTAKLKNAQCAYVLKAKPQKVSKAKKDAGPSAETIAQLQSLAVAGVLPGIQRQSVTAAAGGGFDIATLLKLYAQYKPFIDQWLPLIQSWFKKADKPVVVPDPVPGPAPIIPTDDEINGPAESERTVGRLEAKVFWIARKVNRNKAGGGRFLLDDAGKARVVSGADPLQSGDRVCFDVSPYDTNGVKFEGPKPCDLEHIVGGVGELQQQEENDYTPVVLTPWEGEAGQPGFQGTISYQAKGCGFETRTITLRVRPWK